MRLVSLCAVEDLPGEGCMRAFSVEERQICVANEGGHFAALDNVCPHRGGPLAEGTLEDGQVLCPWHAWAFSLSTGKAAHDRGQSVEVYPLAIEESGVKIALDE